jgi:peptidyl-prolyl cis-trans isomerase A (cyclophilin A)
VRLGALVTAALVFCSCSRQPESAASTDERAPDSYKVRFDTSKGELMIVVTRTWAPMGADRFHTLAKNGFFDGARFFRVVPGFVAQFGIARAPAINAKWRSANLKDDPVTQSNRRGTIAFASESAPNTRAAQVFINLADNARLDSKGFAPFGAVTQGMEGVEQFYSGYGQEPPMGGGPAQSRIESEGNAYLEREFPKLDYIKKATIEK